VTVSALTQHRSVQRIETVWSYHAVCNRGSLSLHDPSSSASRAAYDLTRRSGRSSFQPQTPRCSQAVVFLPSPYAKNTSVE
jgi:hypothetical protein